jgi:hypothetical protein
MNPSRSAGTDGARRLELAESLLQEAVYRSRELQAGVTALARPPSGGGNCGLGERAPQGLELSERGRRLCTEIWPDDLEDRRAAARRATIDGWIEKQDALDRKRNHFLKDFRKTHGFDRRSYSAAVLAEYEAGLERINAQERAARLETARELLAI